MEAYRRSGDITPLILKLAAGWRRVVNLKPRPLYPREGTPAFIKYEAAWAPEFGLDVFNDKNILGLPGFYPRTVRPVAQSLGHVTTKNLRLRKL